MRSRDPTLTLGALEHIFLMVETMKMNYGDGEGAAAVVDDDFHLSYRTVTRLLME